MGRMRIVSAAVLLTALLLLGGCAGGTGAETPPTSAPVETPGTGTASPSEGEQLARTKCTMCHTFDRVQGASKSAEAWATTVDRMVGHGLVVTDAEKSAILDYLANK